MRFYERGRLPSGGTAIVGSRLPPPAAAAFAYQLAFRLGEPVISGLAPAIDAAAHAPRGRRLLPSSATRQWLRLGLRGAIRDKRILAKRRE